MSEVSERLRQLLDEKQISYGELAKLTGIPKSALQRYATGETVKIPFDRLEVIASALQTTPGRILGWPRELSELDKIVYGLHPTFVPGKNYLPIAGEHCLRPVTDSPLPDNIIPMPEMRKIPLLGTIACGEPILAAENIEDEVDVPLHIKADFALRCKGDSMINARIFNGDIVYIRQQPTVENGEIAAVLIGDEATLKRVQLFDDHIILEPENPTFRPIVYWGEEMNNVRILGRAVAFTSTLCTVKI